jgi:bacteriophage N4 adsorption protein B
LSHLALHSAFEILVAGLAVFTVSGALLFTLDDLFLDLAGFWHRVGPRRIPLGDLAGPCHLPEKRFAVLIANWHEQDVIEAMVHGNSASVIYSNYSFFLGVYPNDKPTWEAARRLEAEYPHVSVIVNDRPGPTSKGQLLNHMARKVIASEEASGFHYDAFLLHDSEDIIHPLAFRLINQELEDAEFVQLPVFSLNTPYADFTAGTYADEFAEAHTRVLLAREAMGAAVPSAGVGTAVSRRLALASMARNDGDLLNQKTLTEDYQLGLLAGRLGFRTRFACRYLSAQGKKDYIATREYFPHELAASVRQKTRWVVGIAFQSWNDLGWGKSAAENYFLWRDRRGPFNALLIAAGTLLLMIFIGHLAARGRLPDVAYHPAFAFLCWLNFSQMLWRLASRMHHTAMIYGWKFSLFTPLRWLVGNYVNCVASWKAFVSYRASRRQGESIAWVKTQHRLPLNFGRREKSAKQSV